MHGQQSQTGHTSGALEPLLVLLFVTDRQTAWALIALFFSQELCDGFQRLHSAVSQLVCTWA